VCSSLALREGRRGSSVIRKTFLTFRPFHRFSAKRILGLALRGLANYGHQMRVSRATGKGREEGPEGERERINRAHRSTSLPFAGADYSLEDEEEGLDEILGPRGKGDGGRGGEDRGKDA
jgi:hypothetical protein